MKVLPALGCCLLVLIGAISGRGPAWAPIIQATDWVNGRVVERDLSGKVVIVDVFTFDCINCKHVTPELRALYRRYPRRDVFVVGVHAPETPFERDRGNVIRALAAQGIVWPVAIDNAFTLWNAYGVRAWPTQLIFDRRGTLRKVVVGEGEDSQIDATVKALVAGGRS